MKVSLTNRKIGVQDGGSFSTRPYVGQRPNADSFHDQADMRAGKRLPSPIGAHSGICGPARKGRISRCAPGRCRGRSEEHTSELQSLMRISYAVFCLKKKKTKKN